MANNQTQSEEPSNDYEVYLAEVSRNLEDTLRHELELFGAVSGTLSKQSVVVKNTAYLTSVSLVTLDKHKVTFSYVPYKSEKCEFNWYHTAQTLVVNLDDYQEQYMQYDELPNYLGNNGVSLKDNFTIIGTAKQLQDSFTQDTTLYTEMYTHNSEGITVPSIVLIVDKQTKTIIATVRLDNKDTLVELQTLPRPINLGRNPTEGKVATFIDTFI